MSSVEDARAALESKTRITAGSRSQHTEVMAAADALGDARELRGHVGACKKSKPGASPSYEDDNATWWAEHRPECGHGWYCPDAKEVTA